MKAAVSKVELESDMASRFGDAFRLHEKSVVETLSSGIDEIDVLSGGLPRGSITEIFGPASSGRTSLMYSLLTYATLVLALQCAAAGGVLALALRLRARPRSLAASS